jgi:hypothetical protein
VWELATAEIDPGAVTAVGVDAIAAGIAVAERGIEQATRAAVMSVEPAAVRERRELVEMIRRRGGVTAFELHRSSPSRYRDTLAAGAVLDLLVSAGVGVWENVSHKQGGRPTRRFVAKPDPDPTRAAGGGPDATGDP